MKMPEVQEPSEEEIRGLAAKLARTNIKSSVLAVRSEFQDNYVPEILQKDKLPVNFAHVKNDKYLDMDRNELVEECRNMKFEVTEEQCKNAEYLTKQQRKCKEWYALRHGRVTASIMKAVCVGSVEKPAISTVKQVCGLGSKFTNKATRWGCAHESTATEAYVTYMKSAHKNFQYETAGLFISQEHPHIGASPDGLIKCECCGEGVLEIKCPYCAKNEKICDVEEKVDFLENGSLKPQHKYHYQVETQMLATKRDYCDFVVWTEQGMSIERVMGDADFQSEIIEKSTKYFRMVILPELTGNLISRETLTSSEPTPQKPGFSHVPLAETTLNITRDHSKPKRQRKN